jgi:hypothetical protein
MFGLFRRNKKQEPEIDLDAPLSPEADKYLATATAEFNAKQDALRRDWRFGSEVRWAWDPPTGVFTLEFTDGSQFAADGQLLGSHSPEDFSWEWAWNKPKLEPSAMRDSKLVKEVGEKLGLAYLIVGMVPLPGDLWVTYLSAVGVKATESVGVYVGTAGSLKVAITLKNPRWSKHAA